MKGREGRIDNLLGKTHGKTEEFKINTYAR